MVPFHLPPLPKLGPRLNPSLFAGLPPPASSLTHLLGTLHLVADDQVLTMGRGASSTNCERKEPVFPNFRRSLDLFHAFTVWLMES